MIKIKIVGLTCLLCAWTGSVLAVPYTLPSGPDVSLAQLQTLTDYSTVCETGAPCDVPAGAYQLVIFDALWAPTTTNVVVGGDAPRISVANEVCDVFGFVNPAGLVLTESCTATCPAGAVATGGACSIDIVYDDISTQRPVASIAGENSYSCESNGYIEAHGYEYPLGPLRASVYCLSP